MHTTWLRTFFYLFAVAAIAGAMKWHYSSANVNDLRWVLAPTALVVEMATGANFEFESYSGYMSADRTFLIATPCAGVNFLIVCFLMFGWLNVGEGKLTRLPVLMIVAYGWTILANAARILIAMRMHSLGWLDGSADAEWWHRVEGIFVYFLFLIGLYILANKAGCVRSISPSGSRSFVFVLLPLLAYYAIALVVPILNGAYDSARIGHFASVLLVPLVVWLPFAFLVVMSEAKRKRRQFHAAARSNG